MFQNTRLILFLSAIFATQTVMPMHRMPAKLRTATLAARNNAILSLRTITKSAPQSIAPEAIQTPKSSFASRMASKHPLLSYYMLHIGSNSITPFILSLIPILPIALYDSYTKNPSHDKQKTLMTKLAKTNDEKNNKK